MSHVHQKTSCIDDTLFWSNSLDKSFQASSWLETWNNSDSDKFQFGEDTVDLAGFERTTESIPPNR